MSLRSMGIVCAVVALLVPVPLGVMGQATGVEYRLVIDCPETYLQVGQVVPCPVRATDEQDMMGDPSVAVDPLQPENLIIASLHGGVHDGGVAGLEASCEPGPTAKSRCGQVFTTFTSTDHGASWYDNPFVPPEDVGYAYGEHPAVTIDPYGHVFVGSLYAIPDGGTRFTYVVAAQKFGSLETINEEQDGEYHVEYIDPVYEGNAIGQTWFLFNPKTDNMTMVWNEQVTPRSSAPNDGGVAGRQSRESRASLSPVAAPLSPRDTANPSAPVTADSGLDSALAQVAPEPDAPRGADRAPGKPGDAAAPAGPRSVIGVVWTTASNNESYHYQPIEWAIGPCLTSTNPVLSEGYLYIGCVARTDEGVFPWNPETVQGTVELFRMHPDGGQPQYLGNSPVVGGAPKLGVRSDGRLALVSADAPNGVLSLTAAFGKYNPDSQRIEWGKATNYGAKLEKVDPALRVTGVNVQDMIYREYSGVLHILLKQTIEPVGIGLGAVQATAAPHIRKSIVAIDEDYGILAKMDLDVGNLLNRTDPVLLNAPEAAYNDLSDDFLQLPIGPFQYNGEELGPFYQREFFVVGDYGTVIFAEVIELTTLRGPGIVPAAGPPPPIPAPATSLAVSAVLLPAAGVTVTALIAAAFIVNRRKDPAAAIAKQKK